MDDAIVHLTQRFSSVIALDLLRKQLPLETIAEVTGLMIAQLQQLQSSQ